MSLSATRLADAIVAELKAKGFNLDGAPEMGSSGKSGVEVMVDALAAGTVTELEANWDGEGGGGLARQEHIQTIPSSAWAVPNPLLRAPAGLTVYDTSRSPFLCDVEHADDWSSFTVRPGTAVGGRVTWF